MIQPSDALMIVGIIVGLIGMYFLGYVDGKDNGWKEGYDLGRDVWKQR